MTRAISVFGVMVVFLLMCRLNTLAQNPGGCSPVPPSTLISGGPTGGLRTNNVPFILTYGSVSTTLFRVVIGGQGSDPWAVFSETQIRQHGLWCQVQQANTNNMADSNIGDWYYPTPSGLLALDNIAFDGTPYQELKCENQVGLVVDGEIVNNQGIVRCTTNITGLTTITGLNTGVNYMAVYKDNVFELLRTGGPTIDPNMTLTVLSSRDATPNVQFKLVFNVSFGPPSRILCNRNTTTIIHERGIVSGVDYETIRPLYFNSSLPDVTRVSFEQTQLKLDVTYSCTVFVEGRKNIASATNYDFDILGNATTMTLITVAGTPTDVTTIRSNYNSVLVSWTAPLNPPAGYEVFYQTSAGNHTRLSAGNTSDTELTVTGLTLGVTYHIFVVSYGAEEAPILPSDHSMSAAVTLPTQLPEPANVLAYSHNSSIVVSWTAPQYIPNRYTVFYSCHLLCDSQMLPLLAHTVHVNRTITSYTTPPLSAGSSCTTRVTAVFGSNQSNGVSNSTKTASAAPTGALGGLNITSVESRSLSVVWGNVPCSHQRGPIAGYRLHYTDDSSVAYTVKITGESNRWYQLTGLTPFTRYSIQVAAENGVGTGPYNDPPLNAETLEDFPSPVSSLLAIPGSSQVAISWSPPSEPNGVIITYELQFNNSVVLDKININTSDTHHTLRDLPPNSVVTFSVRAYTIIGPGEYVTGQTHTHTADTTGLLVGLITGWILSIAILIGCIVCILFLLCSPRQLLNMKLKTNKQMEMTQCAAYGVPQSTNDKQIKMTECPAYSTLPPTNVPEYEHITAI